MIIDGRKIANQLLADIARMVAKYHSPPMLVDVLVGDDPVSKSYVNIKRKTAEKVGMDFAIAQLPEIVGDDELVSRITDLQEHPRVCGLIVQLPLPKSLSTTQVLNSINSEVDVDMLSEDSSTSFYNGQTDLIPPTPGAILHILETLPLPANLQYVVMGQGDLVGKPTAFLLKQAGQQVLTIDEDTANPKELLLKADVLITGVGKPGIVTGKDVKEGIVVIDAGTSEMSGAILGDVDFKSVSPKAAAITPVPGGVGPVTVAKLLDNVLQVARQKL